MGHAVISINKQTRAHAHTRTNTHAHTNHLCILNYLLWLWCCP